MNHSFDIDLAEEVGVEAAIIFSNIQHWCLRNAANSENMRDGHAWMYNSRSAWCALFPYLGEKQIRNAIDRLLAAELIARDQFSAGNVNRTYWYRLAERAEQFGRKGQATGQKGQTITVTGTDIRPVTPSVSPQPTKASRRGPAAAIRLEEFLCNSGEQEPVTFGLWARQELGWSNERIAREWTDFHDYWTSGNAVHGGRKADWFATWRSHCLCGTIANERGTDYESLVGISPNSNSMAERFFMGISKGDTPDTNAASKMVLQWVDEFIALLSASGVAGLDGGAVA